MFYSIFVQDNILTTDSFLTHGPVSQHDPANFQGVEWLWASMTPPALRVLNDCTGVYVLFFRAMLKAILGHTDKQPDSQLSQLPLGPLYWPVSQLTVFERVG